MLSQFASARSSLSRIALQLLAAFALVSSGTVLSAQGVETFDPDEMFGAGAETNEAASNAGIDADLADPNGSDTQVAAPSYTPTYTSPQRVPSGEDGGAAATTSTQPGFDQEFDPYSDYGAASAVGSGVAGSGAEVSAADTALPVAAASEQANSGTYGEDDLIGAAEGVFGKGAEGLAKMIQDLLKDQGQPNGYIVGREAGGAFVFGARYGSGTLHHKIEGTRKVYWTGPSVGFDAGANASNTFVLVYNLYDTQDLFKRYAAGEGQAYLIGGLHASYVRRGDVVLIPIRMGVGARLGINAGYLKFSEKQRWLPF